MGEGSLQQQGTTTVPSNRTGVTSDRAKICTIQQENYGIVRNQGLHVPQPSELKSGESELVGARLFAISDVSGHDGAFAAAKKLCFLLGVYVSGSDSENQNGHTRKFESWASVGLYE